MKRRIAIMIIVLFLLQAFAGLQFVNKRTVEEDSTVEQIPAGAHVPERDQGTRNGGGPINHTEEDDMGGSWFDGFDDESGVEWKENVSVEDGMARMDCWKYRRAINISNSGGALTNYQIQVNLTDQNFDYSKAKSGGEDIRFCYSNGTLLNYWIEYWNNETGGSKIWVNVTNIPNGNSQICMYYGNLSAESESDGDGVFTFYDDFNEDSLNLNKWDSEPPSSQYTGWTFEDGCLVMYIGYRGKNTVCSVSTCTSTRNIYNLTNKTIEINFQAKAKGSLNAYKAKTHIGLRLPTNIRNFGKDKWNSCALKYSTDSANLWTTGTWDGSLTPFNKYGMVLTNSKAIFYENNSYEGDYSESFVNDKISIGENIGGSTTGDAGGEIKIDWIRLRKYSASEPTLSFASEELVNSSHITSTPITIPESMHYSILSLAKTEPANTYINISVINATSNTTIPGFDNLTSRNIDISNITAESIRLKAWFFGDGSTTPSLDSWGVEWTAENAWRDSFTGDSKIAYPYGMDEHTVSYWKFDEGSGNLARDLSGNGNDGTLKNMDNEDWVDGRLGKALEFDGSNDYVALPPGTQFNLQTFTVEAWIKNNYCDVFQNIVRIGNNQNYYGWTIQVKNTNVLRFTSTTSNGASSWEATSIGTIDTGVWYHITAVLSGSGETARLYINGVEDGTQTQQAISYSNSIPRIGISGSNTWPFKGTIDEVRISNIARTPEEIRRAYQAGLTLHNGSVELAENELLPEQNTSALWHFNEGEGSEINDSSGNGNDGTVYGANWVEGVHGGALEFDGVDDYVKVSDSDDLDVQSNITIEAWVNADSLPNGDNKEIILGKNNAYGLVWDHTDNTQIVCFNIFSGGPFYSSGSAGQMSPNRWYHIVGVYNGSVISVYVDGIKLNSSNIGHKVIDTNSNHLYLGAVDNTNFFNGAIDEVAIYDRALTASEIYNHSRRYHTNTTLQSTPISLPRYHSWDALHINKTEPDNHYVNVSIIDNAINQTIQNFGKINASGPIDISSIDFREHPVIRLNATFDGNGSDTPVLNSWGVNWTNKCPVLGEPVGPGTINRTEDLNISVPASDFEEYNSKLNFSLEYKLHSSPSWNTADNTNISLNSTFFYFNITPPTDAGVGWYDMRFRLNDSLNATTGWRYYNNSLLIKNNLPVFDGIDVSAGWVNRTANITVKLLNVTDIETSFQSMNLSLWYRLNNTAQWNESDISVVSKHDGNLSLHFTPNAGAALGIYDLKVELDDGDNVTIYVYPNRIQVKNNLPSYDGLDISANEVNRTANVTVTLNNIFDIETPFESMKITLWYRLNNTAEWTEGYISVIRKQDGNLTLRFSPPANASLGHYDLKVELDDSDNVSVYQYPNRILVKNVLPSIASFDPDSDEVFRLSSVELNIEGLSDAEILPEEIAVSVYYRLNGTIQWDDSWLDVIGGQGDGRGYIFSPPSSAQLGPYDFRVELDDNDDTVIFFYPNLVTVKNVLPVMSELNISTPDVLRTASCDLFLYGVMDVETPTDDLNITFWIRENGTAEWENLTATVVNINGSNITARIAFDAGASLGPRDIEITIDDGNDTVSFEFYNVLSVMNNIPVISEDLANLTMWANSTKKYSLAGMGSDMEDDEGNLTWTYNESTVDTSLISNITIDGHNLTIIALKGATGTDEVELRLTDRDGDFVVKNITIEVIPDGQWLAAFLTYPENESIATGSEVNLTWDHFASDSDSLIAYDVYFGNNLTGVLKHDSEYLKNSTTDSHLIVTGLETGARYYWSVIPRNDTSSGVCVPIYQWFEVSFGNRPPTVQLLSPSDGSSMDVTSVELRWSGSDPENGTLTYFIYVSNSRSDVVSEAGSALVGDTSFTTHTLSGLEKGKTYYWSVLPYDGESMGTCLSGIWNFTISESAIEPPEATLAAHASKIFRGEKITFTIQYSGSRDAVKFRVNFQDGTTSEWTTETKITHTFEKAGTYPVSLTAQVNGMEAPLSGKVVITVVDPAVLELLFVQPVDSRGNFIALTGSISGVTWLSNNVSLVAEVNGRTVDIVPALSWSGDIPREYLNEGNNTISVKLLFKGDEIARKERSITITASDTTGGNKAISTEIWIGAVVLVLVLLIILFLVFRRRKKESETEEIREITEEDVTVGEKEEDKEVEGEETEDTEEDKEDREDDEVKEPVEEPEEEPVPVPPSTPTPTPAPKLESVPPSKEKIIPGYTLTHKLGAGGFATVYRAIDAKGEIVAIKLPKFIDETIDISVLDKFRAEADIWKKLKHKNIVSFYKGDIRPVPYMVIEYMEGGNLLELLKGDPLPIDMAISMIQEILSGMAYAHRMASVHRDIKPENILFTQDGVPKISDWGIGKFMASASATKTVGTKGTLAYSSPEQVAREKFGDVDWSTDVFQLGIVFYELLTGVNPIYDDDPVTIISNLISRIPSPPSSLRPGIPPEVDSIILRALEKDKEKRFTSADTMLARLNESMKEREKNLDNYRMVLKKAMKDGMISPDEMELLDEFKKRYGISQAEHDNIERELMP